MSLPLEMNNTWLGYDVPFEEIESHPDVKKFRGRGIKKRVAAPEHHMTLMHMALVKPAELVAALGKAEALFGNALERSAITFDGFGKLNQPEGEYVYLTPSLENGQEAWFLKKQFQASPFYDAVKNCPDLHVSIGGPDPFSCPKPSLEHLASPLTVHGRLILVGHDGKGFRRFAWKSETQSFEEIALATSSSAVPTKKPSTASVPGPLSPVPSVPIVPLPIHTIAIFPKIQADTATAIYILKAFGEQAFPGIGAAPIAFWTAVPSSASPTDLEAKGTLLVDLGGRFDHHRANTESGRREECVSTLIAKYLGVESHPALKKILAWAKRDDLEGKGTISADSLDRAFGLSGIIMNLNREYNATPNRVLDVVLPILDAHVREEIRRTIELPKEWEELLKSGKAEKFSLKQGGAEIDAVLVQSDNIALPGFLRAAKQIDLVVQRRSTNHTNIITKQDRSIDLRPVIEGLRLAEAKKKGMMVPPKRELLQAAGKIEGLDEWYYDTAANTIQNGGVSPEGVPATALAPADIISILKTSIPNGVIGSLKRDKARGR